MWGVIKDVSMPVIMCCYMHGKGEEMDKVFADTGDVCRKMGYLSKAMGDNEFLLGKLSVADFLMFEYLDLFSVLRPGFIDKWKNLCGLKERFASLPAIKAYRESDRFNARPFNGGSAKWS
jgi:glutathione S-transferase